MKKNKILITGASGCVGQYTANWLLTNSDAELFLWLRNPEKLSAIPKDNPRINLLIGDIRNPEIYSKELKEITNVIHTATAWGDPQRAYEVNVLAVKKFLNLLNPYILNKVIYFSTASILNKSLKPLPEAFSYGTEYIQTKAQCLAELEQSPFSKKIIAVFPTLVFGGRVDNESNFPESYLTQGLKEVCQWIWLARFLKINSTFHFIHAEDIAYICGKLATSNQKPEGKENSDKGIPKLVLGQPPISINKTIEILCKWRGVRKVPQIPLWAWLINLLVRILPIQITPWDRFSIKQRHFVHDRITTPESLGGQSFAADLESVLAVSGLIRINRPH